MAFPLGSGGLIARSQRLALDRGLGMSRGFCRQRLSLTLSWTFAPLLDFETPGLCASAGGARRR